MRIGVAIVLALLSVLLAAESVLTTEEVVRLWASGTPVRDLLLQIRERDADFDLSPEVVTELRAAGLPEELIRAMRRRQGSIDRGPSGTADMETEEGESFRVRLNGKQQEPRKRRLRVRDEIDIPLQNLWRLDVGARFSDVGLFLACSTADHVPDHWRSKTPLVWESPQMPRHRILQMAAGASWGRATVGSRLGLGGPKVARNEDGSPRVGRPPGVEGPGMLVLNVPLTLETRLQPGVAHDLHVGIAFKVDGKFYPWTIAALDDVIVEDGPLELDAMIRGLRNAGIDTLDIEFDGEVQRKYRARTICARGCPKR